MKKLIPLLILLSVVLGSCSQKTVARISYKELPNKYKDMVISKNIIVRGDYVYVTTISGTEQKIDTKIFDVEIAHKKY